MNGYTVFLGPFAGIMVSDVCHVHVSPLRFYPSFRRAQYWLVHRGKVDVPAMYQPHGRYRYTYGFVSFSLSGPVGTQPCPELACGARDYHVCPSHFSRAYQIHQSEDQNWRCGVLV